MRDDARDFAQRLVRSGNAPPLPTCPERNTAAAVSALNRGIPWRYGPAPESSPRKFPSDMGSCGRKSQTHLVGRMKSPVGISVVARD